MLHGAPTGITECPYVTLWSSAHAHLVRAHSGFTVTPAGESGDKLTRFGPFSSQCRDGNIKIRRGRWNEDLFRVLEGFPDLTHDDEVDACSGALEMLNRPMNSWGVFEFYRRRAQ
jgi:predicted phage terminase large subunit-like protein